MSFLWSSTQKAIWYSMETYLICDSLPFFGILAGRCGNVVVRERDQDTKGPGSRSRFDPGLRFCFFLIEKLSITGQKFSKCLKNGSDRLRKGQLRRRGAASLRYRNPPKLPFSFVLILEILETCVAEQLTLRTPDLEVLGSSLARRVVFLDKEIYSTVSLHPGVFNNYSSSPNEL